MDEVLYKSIINYFTALGTFGYKDYQSVYKLLALLFIQEVLDSNCYSQLSEEEIRVYQKTNECLMGSICLIPYK